MINLLFIFGNILTCSFIDAWSMTKTILPYWGYCNAGFTGYNPTASEESAEMNAQNSFSFFAFWYFYVIISAYLLFDWQAALVNIICIALLHWTGSEDLGYYLFVNTVFPNPPKYQTSHKFVKVLGLELPESLYWLATPRKIWFFTVPSVIGFVCGQKVEGRKFFFFAISIIAIVILSAII
jgi:hypothetical protein